MLKGAEGVEGGKVGGPFVDFHCQVVDGVVFVVVEGEQIGVRSVKGAVGAACGRGVEGL